MQARFARKRAEKQQKLASCVGVADSVFESFRNFDSQISSLERNWDPSQIWIDREQYETKSDEETSKTLNRKVSEDQSEKIFTNGFWSSLPPTLDPGSELCQLKKEGRAVRKRLQLGSLIGKILPVLDRMIERNSVKNRKIRIVDFCAGTGHVGVLLAWLRRGKVIVECVERCPQKCEMGNDRVRDINENFLPRMVKDMNDNFELENPVECSFIACSLEEYTTGFDLGVTLHSCGLLTDKVLDLSYRNTASFVLSPCCYGQIGGKERTYYLDLFGMDSEFTLPQSKTVRMWISKSIEDEKRREECILIEKKRIEWERQLVEERRLVEEEKRIQETIQKEQKVLEEQRKTVESRIAEAAEAKSADAVVNAEGIEKLDEKVDKEGQNGKRTRTKEEKAEAKRKGREIAKLKGKGKGKSDKRLTKEQPVEEQFDAVTETKPVDEMNDFFCDLVVCADLDVAGDKDSEGKWSFAGKRDFFKVKKCMNLVDLDRLLRIAERSGATSVGKSRYNLTLTSLKPLDCTPKNDVIIGEVVIVE